MISHRAARVVMSLHLAIGMAACRCARVPAHAAAATEGSDASVKGPDRSVPGDDGGPTPPDGGFTECAPDLLDGGLTWESGIAASLVAPQQMVWQQQSTAAECAALTPAAVPTSLMWAGPSSSASCDPVVVDGAGNLAVFSLSGATTGNTFLRSDTAAATFARDGVNELQVVVAPRSAGFVVLPQIYKPWCELGQLLTPGVDPSTPFIVESTAGSQVLAVAPNPRGGFVEVRKVDGRPARQELELQTRWVDAALNPLADWHTVMTWRVGLENVWRAMVDEQGRALIVAFVFPPSLGAPPPPSMWNFTARWMNANGPLTDSFQPIAPTYTAPNGTILFADWDTIRPLQGGGFAMFHAPATRGSGGTISPSGWYAFYPSGQGVTAEVPAWLRAYDGSLQLLAGGVAYAAVQQDSTSCAQTIQLIAPSGMTCFTLAVESADLCGMRNAIWPDGTLVLQSGCAVSWWPRVARPGSL